MYAIIQSGGKQYRVQAGQRLKLEKLAAEPGATIKFDKILMVSKEGESKIGVPFVSGYAVQAEVVAHGRADKINIIKFKRRKHHMKRQGHRQWYTEVKITDILAA